MSTPTSTTTATTDLQPGLWTLDPKASTVTFRTRAIFGLMKVLGSFSGIDGDIRVDDRGEGTGSLAIEVATIDTGIPKRDAHLNRDDFFHVERHPHATFVLDRLAAGAGGELRAVGILHVKDKQMAVDVPVTATTSGSRLRIDAQVDLDHGAAGLPFAKPLLISKRAAVSASLSFERA